MGFYANAPHALRANGFFSIDEVADLKRKTIWPVRSGVLTSGSLSYNATGSTLNNYHLPAVLFPNIKALSVTVSRDAAAINGFAAVVLEDNTLWNWGTDQNGYLGRGSTASTNVVRPPAQVGGAEWVKVAAGTACLFAIKTDGTLWATGLHTGGRTGLGLSSGQVTVFTKIGTDTDWVDVYDGTDVNFAKKADGSIWGWGVNAYGRVGNGLINGSTLSPSLVGAGGDTWIKASASASHSVFLKSDGTLWVTGLNANYKTGVGTSTGTTNVLTQTAVGATHIDAGAGFDTIVAIRSDGTLWGVGRAQYAALGNNSTSANNWIRIGAMTGWEALSSSGNIASTWIRRGPDLYYMGQASYGPSSISTITGPVYVGTAPGEILFADGGYGSTVISF